MNKTYKIRITYSKYAHAYKAQLLELSFTIKVPFIKKPVDFWSILHREDGNFFEIKRWLVIWIGTFPDAHVEDLTGANFMVKQP